MKKVKTLTVVLFLVFLTSGISAKGGIGFALGEPAGLTLRFDKFPVITVGYSWYGRLLGSVDYWFINKKIDTTGPVMSWYFGGGVYGGFYTGPYEKKGIIIDSPLLLGARAPIGIQYFPKHDIEIFLEGAPALRVLPGIAFDWQVALGVRFLIFK